MEILLLILVFCVTYWYLSKPQREKKALAKIAQEEKLVEDAKLFLQYIQENHAVPTIQTSLFLKKGEQAILEEPRSTLQETRAVRRSSGGFGGVRVAKGVTLGGYKGSSSSTQEWTSLDEGSLVVTNKRIVFTGNKETRSLDLSKLLSAEVNVVVKNIEVNVSNRKKGLHFNLHTDQNMHIWSLVFQLLQQGADLLSIEDPDFDVTYTG